MKKYNLILVLFCLLTQLTFSQELSHLDSISRTKANNVIEKHFANTIDNNSYVLFSIEDKWYLILISKPNGYEEYYYHGDTIIRIDREKCFDKERNKEIMSLVFDKEYHKGFINLNSDFYKNGYEISQGNITYFYFKDNKGNVYGESKLTTIIKPNPINENVYGYLLTKLLSCIEKEL